MDIVKQLEAELVERKDWPDFKAGDTIAVTYSIREGDKRRQQTFTGTVIQRRGSGSNETFTIRKVSNNVGVERVIPFSSPFIEEIKVLKSGSVRRSRIFYLRKRQGKAARIKERKFYTGKEGAGQKAGGSGKKEEPKAKTAEASKEAKAAPKKEEPKAKKESKPAPASKESSKAEATAKKPEAKKSEDTSKEEKE